MIDKIQKEVKRYDPKILDQFIEVEIDLPQKFLIIKETLTRIGVSPKGKKNLYQSCHILNANGKTYLVHFKELFLLDGKTAVLEETDIYRRNMIAHLFQDWNLLKIIHPERFPIKDKYMKLIKILSANDPNFSEWKLIPKYHIRSGG